MSHPFKRHPHLTRARRRALRQAAAAPLAVTLTSSGHLRSPKPPPSGGAYAPATLLALIESGLLADHLDRLVLTDEGRAVLVGRVR
ncbi:hypothetical protein [Pararhodospirillum photometricum]|uniref:Uncharacterized protein n=1 Tax=Pararhodospirillum photometricum DSM 122 TaxID=1150469 RepID=H6SQM3_PARPM|nr:hypothetical protein [Pararhodospirillum photometricum]CCG07338.1 unnamed protein product [Pararhodospirillum photometricum DSM 122]